MRIGMMADLYKPHISGVTNYIDLNKRYLERLGHEVFVFTFKDNNYEDEEEHVIRSPGISVLDFGFSVNLRFSREARNILKTMDIVHVHHPFVSGSLTVSFCKRRKIPIVFTNHTRYDLYVQAYLPPFAEAIGETAIETFIPAFCRAVDLVITPSAGMMGVLKKLGVDSEIVVVPNGVDIKRFQEVSQKQDRSLLGFNQDDVLLAFVGRLGAEKNLPFLLRSFAGAFQAYNQIGLILIGDGPERENLKHLVHHMEIEDRVKFTGLIPYIELPKYLAMADAFVTASVTEVHPLSVIEAMATGLPVLGIQSPGVGDTVVDGETGYLAKDEDLAAFTAKLVKLIADGDKRKEMGNQGRLLSEQYSIERTSEIILDYYRNIIRKSEGRKRGIRMRMNKLFSGRNNS